MNKSKKYLALVLALVLTVAALMLSGCTDKKTVTDAVNNAVESAKDAAADAKDAVEGAAADAKDTVETAVEDAKDAAADAKDAVEGAVADAKDAVETAVEDAKNAAADAKDAVEAAADTLTVMTYEEYAAAAVDDPIVIETYVQAKQSWWDNKASLYTQDKDGAYYIYNSVCSEEDYAKLVPGTKIRVTGYKAEWSGEVEVAAGATIEIIEDAEPYIAEATDVTALLGTDELINEMNKFVSFKGMTVEPSKIKDAEGNEGEEEYAFLYSYDGSGQKGANSDLYFNLSKDGQTYTFTVESYLCGEGTDVYSAVEALNIGDVIDLEGFLYWYNGANPHITSVTPAAAK